MSRNRNSGTMKIDLIRDEATQQLMKKELKLKEKLNSMRGEMRKAQDEKDKNIRAFEPQRDKFADQVGGELDTLMERKNELHQEMDEIKILQNNAGQTRDTLKMLDFEATPLQKQIYEHNDKLKDSKANLTKLEAQRAAMSPAYKNLTDADNAINRIDTQLAAATKENNSKKITSLAKQKSEAEKGKREVQSSYTLDDRIIAERRRIDHTQNSLDKKTEQKSKVEEERKSLRAKLDAGADTRKQFDKLREELQGVSKKIETARNKRKEKRPVNEELKGLNENISKLREERESLNKELEEVQKSLGGSYHTVKFESEYRGDIIGKGGATIEQLQLDFGVAVDIDLENSGELAIIGGADDIKTCEEAIIAICEHAKNTRQKATIKFNPELAKSFIGARGSNIEKMQTTSGAQIKLSENKEEIFLTGTNEALEIAKTLIEEFLFNSCQADLKFDIGIREFIIGKQGAVIRKIEKDSGVKRINIDSDIGLITIFGNKDAVAKAKALYEDIIQGMSGNAFTMRADERMVKVIIGRGGETIRSIQATSGAAINVARGTVTIRGGKDAVATARQMIEDIARRDEVKIPYDIHLHSFLTTRPLAVQDRDADGNKVQDVEEPCPLERVKLESKCDRVSAARSDQKIVIIGKRENVNHARAMLEELFRANRPHVTKVAYNDVLRTLLIKRSGSGNERTSVLDRIKLEHTGVVACDINRATSMVEIAGSAESVKNGAAALEAFIGEYTPFIRTIKYPAKITGTIIGSGGSNIADLTGKTKTEIRIDKDKSELIVLSLEKNEEALDAVEKAIEDIKSAEV